MLRKPQVRNGGGSLDRWCSLPVQSNSLTQDLGGKMLKTRAPILYNAEQMNTNLVAQNNIHFFIPQFSWVLSWVPCNQSVGRKRGFIGDSRTSSRLTRVAGRIQVLIVGGQRLSTPRGHPFPQLFTIRLFASSRQGGEHLTCFLVSSLRQGLDPLLEGSPGQSKTTVNFLPFH